VALRTGLRRGELLGLRWEDVDLSHGRIRVVENYVRDQFKAPKSGKPREVPLSGEARAALAQHRERRGGVGARVFSDAQSKPYTPGVMASQLKRACRLAGLRVIGWHVLRHYPDRRVIPHRSSRERGRRRCGVSVDALDAG
jgi:integrase